MNRSENINDAAKNELRRRRQKAEQIAADRRAELCKKSEKFARLEQKYNELSKALVKAAISGNAAERTALSGELSHTAKEEEKILEASGIDTDFLKPQYRCKECGDQGVLSNGQACDCLKKLKSDLRYAGFCKELPLDGFSLDTFSLDYYSGEERTKMGDILLACRDFSKKFPNSGNLIFSGRTGLGKTHLSLSIVREVAEKGYSAMYNSAQNFFNLIENDSFGNGNLGIREELISCDLCVLDDLGAEFSTEFTRSALYNIINSRIIAKRPTIISTNLDAEKLEQKYGERIFSRVIGCFDWKNFCGKDIRVQKKFENRKD